MNFKIKNLAPLLLCAFALTASAQPTTNNPGIPIFGSGGVASGLQSVFVNGLGNLASPANFAAQNAGTIVSNPGATNSGGVHVAFLAGSSNTWFVAPAPLGNDNNTGLTALSPFQSVLEAEQHAISGDTIHLMDGSNVVGSPLIFFPGGGAEASASNYFVQLGNGINWYSEPNAWLWITNYSQGSAQNAYFCCYGNNYVDSLKLFCPDALTVNTAFGLGDGDVIDFPIPRTNIVVNNYQYVGYAGGIHYEIVNPRNATNPVSVTFINPVIKANAAPVILNAGRTNLQVRIIGGDLTCINFTNTDVSNNKPLRVFDIEDAFNTPTLIAQGITCHLSDMDLSSSNRPGYMIWAEAGISTGVATFKGCIFDWLSRTNAGSMDLSTNPPGGGSFNLFNCSRSDGSAITFPAGTTPNLGENLDLIGGTPTLTVLPATQSLIISSNLAGNDRAMVLSFNTSSATQQTLSNYFVINLSQATSTNPVIATLSPLNYGPWTNAQNSSKPLSQCFGAITTSNTITIESLISPATSSSYSMAIHVDQP